MTFGQPDFGKTRVIDEFADDRERFVLDEGGAVYAPISSPLQKIFHPVRAPDPFKPCL
jgi:hypothetical protein